MAGAAAACVSCSERRCLSSVCLSVCNHPWGRCRPLCCPVPCQPLGGPAPFAPHTWGWEGPRLAVPGASHSPCSVRWVQLVRGEASAPSSRQPLRHLCLGPWSPRGASPPPPPGSFLPSVLPSSCCFCPSVPLAAGWQGRASRGAAPAQWPCWNERLTPRGSQAVVSSWGRSPDGPCLWFSCLQLSRAPLGPGSQAQPGWGRRPHSGPQAPISWAAPCPSGLCAGRP